MTTAAATQFLPVVATASAAQSSLVVSVHDVAPSTREVADVIVSRLRSLGARVCSLLVVPDYHHHGLVANDQEFISWLRRLEADGNEIVIHGYFHHRPRQATESWRDKFMTRLYTRGEGEFFDLGYDEAFKRITSARDMFREAGLNPRGFIAPAWLLSAAGEQAARDADMEYTTRLRTVLDLRSGQDFPARSLVYSVETDWRRAVSLAWNSTLFKIVQEKPLMRVSIHPPDYSFPAIRAQIERFISEIVPMRIATTYRDWIAEQRIQN